MVARYLGVVEVAGSNPVTQTKTAALRSCRFFPRFLGVCGLFAPFLQSLPGILFGGAKCPLILGPILNSTKRTEAICPFFCYSIGGKLFEKAIQGASHLDLAGGVVGYIDIPGGLNIRMSEPCLHIHNGPSLVK